MNASDVYNIAKALPAKEFEELYGMLKTDVLRVYSTNGNKLVIKFTIEDGIKYLLDNHFRKVRKT